LVCLYTLLLAIRVQTFVSLVDGIENAEASYQSTCSSLVCALPGNLEGDIVWSIALDLESCGGEVVEVLVKQLCGKS
jgi:hypothetical protein